MSRLPSVGQRFRVLLHGQWSRLFTIVEIRWMTIKFRMDGDRPTERARRIGIGEWSRGVQAGDISLE